MKIPYRYRPGWGFLILALSAIVAVAFLVFGFRQPELDACWMLQERFKTGTPSPTEAQTAEALACLQRVEGLAEATVGEPGTGLFSGLIDGLRPGHDALVVKAGASSLELQCRRPGPANLVFQLQGNPQTLTPGKPVALVASKAPLALAVFFSGTEDLGCLVVAR